MRVAHVVRRYGGITEPFIEARVRASGDAAELWYERLDRPAPCAATVRVAAPVIGAGSLGDRAFHHIPWLGRLAIPAYAATERGSVVDLIHAHYLTTGYLVGQATRRPLVVSAYGFDITIMPRRPGWQAAFAALAQRAGAVLVEGPFMRASAIDLGFSERTVRVVPIAAQLDRIAYRDPPHRDGPPTLLACGRFVEKKGLDVAIRAFRMIVDEVAGGATLEIVGDGPAGPALRRLVQELGLSDRVTMLGALPRERYLERLTAADLLLAPSRRAANGDGEGGAPTTILDAQATGVVVVGSTHADIPFLIEDGETGYLVEEGSPGSLATGIIEALKSREAWETVARRARRQVLERHSDAALGRMLDAIYQEVGGC